MSAGSPASSRLGPIQVGRYEVHQEIGRGSTGTVYLAQDPLIGRWVALKTLSRDVAPEAERIAALRHQLLNEARSAGSLSHPGIVAVHDVIEHDGGRVSIAMEYVEGSDLRRRLEDPEPLPLEFCGRVISEVAAVLDYAHSQGVVHRDIKPANILLAADGAVKVTDFGIASLRDADLADELKNLGTPNYLSPERLLGQEANPQSDVYALGVVLYELLTRNPPFSGATLGELVRNIVHKRPAPLDHYRPDIYPEIQALLTRALAKEPSERYASAEELAAELRSALERRSQHNDTVPTPRVEELELVEEPERLSVSELGVVPEPEPEPVPEPEVREPEAVPEAELPEPGPPPPRAPEATAEAPRLQASPPPERPLRRRLKVLALPVIVGLAAAAVFFAWRSLATSAQRSPELEVVAAGQDDRLEYLRLLAESRRLFAAGDRKGAERLLDQAEALSPAAARIRRLRDTVRQEAVAERSALLEAECLDHLDAARRDLEAGRLRSASANVSRALAVLPDHQEARRLQDYIARLRAQQLTRERARQAIAAPVEPEEPPEEPTFEPFTPIVSPPASAPARTSGIGDLRIDFYSFQPRGVLTVYADSQQILNRPFRFVEKKKLLRRKGISGGFDERAQIEAGDLELRVYLSLPERETQLQTLIGSLPADSLRTLRVRVDADGQLVTELH